MNNCEDPVDKSWCILQTCLCYVMNEALEDNFTVPGVQRAHLSDVYALFTYREASRSILISNITLLLFPLDTCLFEN